MSTSTKQTEKFGFKCYTVTRKAYSHTQHGAIITDPSGKQIFGGTIHASTSEYKNDGRENPYMMTDEELMTIINNHIFDNTAVDISQLTEPQKKILALLAYSCLHRHMYREEGEKWREKAQTAEHACALLDIPNEVIMKVRSGILKGLQNLNRLDLYATYNENFNF